jgi:hypothetical protein
MLACVQFVIIPIKLQEVLGQEKKNVSVAIYHNPNGMNHTKTMDVSLLHFYGIRNE